MDKFGIIGNPVVGSMSPRLFAAAYGGRWPYELIEGADIAPVLWDECSPKAACKQTKKPEQPVLPCFR